MFYFNSSTDLHSTLFQFMVIISRIIDTLPATAVKTLSNSETLFDRKTLAEEKIIGVTYFTKLRNKQD
jgi:hypothetical protein